MSVSVEPQVRSSFLRQIATVALGTAGAQAIGVLASPVYSRLFTPAEIGVASLMVSVAAFLMLAATGRYELAIPVPKLDVDGVALGALALGLTLVASAVGVVVVLGWAAPLATRLGIPDQPSLALWIPLFAFVSAAGAIATALLNRALRFRSVAHARVVQALVTAGATIGLGFAGYAITGYLLGLLAGQLAFGAITLVILVGVLRESPGRLVLSRIALVARRFMDLPRFSVLGSVLNQGATQVPLYILTALASAELVGHFSMAQRVSTYPVILLAGATAEVFAQRAAQKLRAARDCRPLFLATLRRSLLVGLMPSVALAAFGPDLFAFVFGEAWRESGHVARILSPLVLLQFAQGPLGTLFYLRNRQRQLFLWQLSLLFVVTVALWGPLRLGWTTSAALVWYVAGYSAMYVICLLMAYPLAKGGESSSS